MTPAPFYSELAEGPNGGHAVWLTADDNVRIRLVVWPEKAARGTVLIFPGRTEWAEKYGRAAAEFAKLGYGSISIDWRGQGLADRLYPDRDLGHVGAFLDYQRDIAAVMAALPALGMTGPSFLCAHSMGGMIGLRALIEGLNVRAAAFSGPMWSILMPPGVRPLTPVIGAVAQAIGTATHFAPGSGPANYVLAEPFEGNTLTHDRDHWDYMVRHIIGQPGLSLGGPSMHWVTTAMAECNAVARLPSPATPTVTFLGADEAIVDPVAIRDRMGRWPGGKLVELSPCQHETMMETPAIRARVFAECATLFEANA